MIIGLGFIPQYVGLFLMILSLVSVEVFVYFLVRMLAPPENPKRTLHSKRHIVVKALIVGVFLVQTIGVVSRYLFDISPETLHPFAPLIAILFYSTAVAVGYDSAMLNNALDRAKALSKEEVSGTPLIGLFSGKSEKKALSVVVGCIIIGLIVGVFTSLITGLSTAGSIATFLALGAQLYPDVEDSEDK